MPSLMKWFPVTLPEVLGVLLSVIAIYLMIIVLTRVFGLRSFSKMSTGDFAMTVAVGSLFGTAIANPNPTVGLTFFAFLGLFGGQTLLAWARQRSSRVSNAVDNRPLLLMRGEDILYDNLRRAKVSEDDLRGKLREANVLQLSQVQAVVFEVTGDVSVLHSATEGAPIDAWLLTDVEDGERVPSPS